MANATSTGAIAELILDKSVETFDADHTLVSLVNFEQHDPEKMQLSGNTFWRSITQQSEVLDGFQLVKTDASGIIVPTIPYTLGIPKNTLTEQLVQNMRTTRFWVDKAEADAKKLRTALNQDIGEKIRDEGAIYIDSTATNGFDFVDEASLFFSERQLPGDDKHMVFNPRDLSKFASELAGRETVKGRPEDAWRTGEIGPSALDFTLHKSTANPAVTGAADPAITVTGDQSFKPEAGSEVDGVVTNIDHRNALMVFSTTAGLSRGDKFTLENGGTAVEALKLDTKGSSGQAMVFTIKSVVNGTTAIVSPKPIAYNDAALSDHEKEYSNIDTQILNAATLTRLNVAASKQTSLIFDKMAISVVGGTIPAELFKEYGGNKVISRPLASGLTMYVMYDGDVLDMTFRYRCFVWWGVNIVQPPCCGVAVTS